MPTDPYLGTTTFMRTLLDSLLPEGSAWRPAPGQDLDNLLHGVADSLQGFEDFAGTLDDIRNPLTTPYLDELEREYGIAPNPQISDVQRRAILHDRKFHRNVASTKENLQNALNQAGLGTTGGGYGLQVFVNDPPVDPGLFTNFAYQCVCGGANAYCGFIPTGGAAVTAVCGVNGGLWVVNGDLFTIVPQFQGCGYIDPGVGSVTMCCGYIPAGGSVTTAVCGYFKASTYLPLPVADPPSTSWPLVFFIAKTATYQQAWAMNDIAPLSMGMGFSGQSAQGQISTLAMTSIPNALRFTLVEIIMRWKPAHCWAALMVNFT